MMDCGHKSPDDFNSRKCKINIIKKHKHGAEEYNNDGWHTWALAFMSGTKMFKYINSCNPWHHSVKVALLIILVWRRGSWGTDGECLFPISQSLSQWITKETKGPFGWMGRGTLGGFIKENLRDEQHLNRWKRSKGISGEEREGA